MSLNYFNENWHDDTSSNENISLQNLLSEISESFKYSKDDFLPKDYQCLLARSAVDTNKIIYLPLKEDKKYTSLLILKYLAQDIEKDDKKIFYLSDSCKKVSSVKYFLQKHLYYDVVGLEFDCADKKTWINEISSARIIVISTKFYLHALLKWFTDISEAYLLIFDDCVFGKGGHSMNEILNYLHKHDESKWPKIVGFTSSLIHQDEKNNIFLCLSEMERKFKSSIVSSYYCDTVKRYLPRINVKFVKFQTCNKNLYDFNDKVPYLEKVIGRTIAIINKLKLSESLKHKSIKSKCIQVFKDILFFLSTHGSYCAYVVASIHRVGLEKMKQLSDDSAYFILSAIISDLYIIRLIICEHVLKTGSLNTSKTIVENCPGKIVRLFNVLYKLDMHGNCVVLVEKSIVAKMIAYILQKLSKCEVKMSHVVANYITGSDSALELNSDREIQLYKKQRKQIEKRFANGLINVLILTWDSGVENDSLSSNWILYYDMPSTFSDYIVSRKFASISTNNNFFFLEEINREKFLRSRDSLEQFIELDLALKDILLMKDINEEERLRKSILIKETEAEIKERFPPFLTKTKKRATLSSAINIINQYCQCLPGDVFSFSAPQWSFKKKDGGVVCKLQLPIQSGIDSPIECPPIKNIKFVKQVTALEAVKFMYKSGQLDDNLQSKFYNVEKEYHNVDLFPHWKTEDLQIKSGSSKCFRTVPLKFPKWFNNTSPQPNTDCYLHIIQMKPIYTPPTDNSKSYFHKLMLKNNGYGILSSKKLPQICKFPVYTDLGHVDIMIKVNAQALILTQEEIDSLKRCHKFIFIDVLQIVKRFLISDSSNGDNSYCFVPLIKQDDGTMKIDWGVVNSQCEKVEIIEPTENERLHADYSSNQYLGKVVTPWYRMPSQRYYIVTNASTGLKPGSPFPSEKYETYTNYYSEKHALEVKHPLQPLVEARFIPNNLKCTRPRAQTPSLKKKEGEKDQDMNVILLPEFCVKQHFPAVYWYKAILLSAITYRLHFILLAEELRRKFAGKANTNDIWPHDPSDVLFADETSIPEVKDMSKSVVPLFSILNKVRRAKNNRKYCWGEDKEPLDVNRNIEDVHVMDLMAYCDFIKTPPNKQSHSTNDILYECRYPEFLDLKFDLNFYPKQRDIVQALTSEKSDDIFNLERFKIIGKSFINFSVSFWLYKLYPNFNVLQLRNLKRRITGKENLYYCGANLELGSYCQMYDYSVNNDWFSVGFCLPEVFTNILENSFVPPDVIFKLEIPREEQYTGQISAETRNLIQDKIIDFYNHTSKQDEDPLRISISNTGDHNHTIIYFKKHSVSDKTVADCLRALSGVYLLNNGIEAGFELLQFCGVLKQKVSFDDVYRFNSVVDKDVFIGGYNSLITTLNYEFKNKNLLLEALTHHTYYGDTKCNQKFAFLGESILDLLITGYVFKFHDDLKISDLEDLRSCLVNDIIFAVLTIKYGLYKYLLVDSIKLIEKIDKFVEKEKMVNFSVTRSDFLYLIEESNNRIKKSVDIPKICGDLLKAIVAAVFLDTCGNLKKVWEIVYCLMKDEIDKFSTRIPKDPVKLFNKTALQTSFGDSIKYSNSDLVIIPFYIEVDDVKKIYYGIGSSKSQAKRLAAKLAIKDIALKDSKIN